MFAYIDQLDGQGVTLTVEVTIHPVAGVEDELAFGSFDFNVINHLHVQLEAVTDTVPTFCQIDVVCGLEKNAVVRDVKLEAVEVEAAASGTDAIFVECVFSGYCIGWDVSIGKSLSRGSLTVGRSSSVNTILKATKSYGNGERIATFTKLLNPVNLALVVVQLVADTTVGEFVEGNNGCGVVVAPLLGGVVVVVGTSGTVSVGILIVGLEVYNIQVAAVTCNVSTGTVGDVEGAAIADNQTVCNVDLVICPANDTAAVLGLLSQNSNLYKTVLDDGATISDTNQAAIRCVTFLAAVDGYISIAATDATAVPASNTSSELCTGGDGTLHFQVLNYSMNTYIAEESCAILLKGHVVGDGVTSTVEETLEVLAVTTDSVVVGALVNVSRQDSIGIGIITVHEFSESFQVFRSTNLIDAIHFGQCPCYCGDNAQQSGHTQIQ